MILVWFRFRSSLNGPAEEMSELLNHHTSLRQECLFHGQLRDTLGVSKADSIEPGVSNKINSEIAMKYGTMIFLHRKISTLIEASF